MTQSDITVTSENSWKTYLLTCGYPTFIFALIIFLVIFRGQAYLGHSLIRLENLPLVVPFMMVILAVAGWIGMHRRVTLNDIAIVISSPKIGLSVSRTALWELSSIRTAQTWFEKRYGLVHLEFLDSISRKSGNDVTGLHCDEAEAFVRIANERISAARTLPHDPLPMDESQKIKSRRWQRIGIAVLILLIIGFGLTIYVLGQVYCEPVCH